MNRETWLNQLAELMRPRFAELGFPLPAFRVSVGFTAAGKSMKVAAECWHNSASADRHFEILISPINDDAMKMAGDLAHELIHAAVGFKCKHKGNFEKIALAIGLARPMTATTPGPTFVEWAKPFLEQLGPLPHARISWLERSPRPVGEDGEEIEGDEDEGGSSNAKKKQSTRMLKAACRARVQDEGGEFEECGYTVRLSKKWALKLGACCPAHGALEIDGMDEPGDGEQDAE